LFEFSPDLTFGHQLTSSWSKERKKYQVPLKHERNFDRNGPEWC